MPQLQFTSNVHLLEASATGGTWDVVLIEAGTSLNGTHYPESALRENLNHFDGVKAFAYDFAGRKDHLPPDVREKLPQGTSKNLVGYYSLPRIGKFKKPDGTEGTGVLAKFHVTASWLRDTLKNAYEKGKKDLLGFSIDGLAQVREMVSEAGQKFDEFLGFDKLDEVTVVTSPAAGGRIINLVESYKQVMEMAQMKELLKKLKESHPQYFGQIDENSETLADDIHGGYAKLEKALSEKHADDKKSDSYSLADINAQIAKAVAEQVETKLSEVRESEQSQQKQISESKKRLTEAVNQTTDEGKPFFTEQAKQKILSDHAGRVLTETDVNGIVKREREYYASLQESGLFVPGQEKEKVEIGTEELEKQIHRMTAMLTGERVIESDGKKYEAFRSPHHSYRAITGFSGSPGQMGRRILNEAAVASAPLSIDDVENDQDNGGWRQYLRESAYQSQSLKRASEATLITTTWAEVYGEGIRRAMIKRYGRIDLQTWRKIVSTISSPPDFRTNRRIRVGGYGNLDAVAENGTYQEKANLTDVEETFAVTKRGNLKPLSLEAMTNDDLGAIQEPARLGDAAAQTLYEFVFDDLFSDNPTMNADSTALFDAAHGNLGSTALAEPALETRVVAMADQTEQDSGKIIGVFPKYLIVPNELMKEGWELTTGSVSLEGARTETIENFWRTYGIETIVVPHWTDADNWYMVADPALFPTIEVGFLGGRQEPELFVQDQPTIGSVFTADKITYKIRHIYGGTPLDWRTMDGNVV